MSKTTVTQLFVGATLAVVAGLVLGVAALVAALADGAVAVGGPDGFSVDGGAFAGMVIWLTIASLLIGGGALAAIVSWIGALLDTMRLVDKTWFVFLLVAGLLSFGWIAMAAYVLAGPNDPRAPEQSRGITAAHSS